MKNSSISDQISLQKQMLASEKENIQIALDADVQIGKNKSTNADLNIDSSDDLGAPSVSSTFYTDGKESKKAEENLMKTK